MCQGCLEVHLGLLVFLGLPVTYARRKHRVAVEQTFRKQTSWCFFSLVSAQTVYLQPCWLRTCHVGQAYFINNRSFLILLRKHDTQTSEEASSRQNVNSSLLFIAKFGIPQCLPKHPQTPPAIDSANLLVEVADRKNVGATVSLLMLED